MTMPKYKVVLNGDILPQVDRSTVLSRMQDRFRIDAQKAEKLLQGRPKVIKKDLDEQAAGQYAKALARIGLVCQVEPQNGSGEVRLEMKRGKESLPPSTAVCPKCDHPFGHGLVTECPNCGVVVDKYLTLQEAAGVTDQTGEAAETSSVGVSLNTEAPWLVRFSAGVASLVVPGALICIISFVAAMVFSFKFNKMLIQPISAMDWDTERQMAQIVIIHGIVVLSAAAIILFWYFILGPIRKGGTWAQRFADLVIVSARTGENPGWMAWPLRAIGSTISFAGAVAALAVLCPLCAIPMIPVIRLVQNDPLLSYLAAMPPFLLGFYILYKSGAALFGKNGRSLADKFSGTRQLRKDEGASMDSTALWAVIIVAALLSAGSGMMARKLMTRFNPAVLSTEVTEAGKTVDMKILEKTHQFQARYHQEHGAYTDNAPSLAQEYCDTRGLGGMQNRPFIDAVFDGRLELALTETGYRAELKIKDHPEVVHVYTEAGYQGIESHETE